MVKVKDMPKIERPREKLLKYGVNNLSDEELFAIILGSGTKGHNVLSVSKKVMKLLRIKNYNNIEFGDLLKVIGLGATKAMQILSVLELTKRFNNKQTEILSAKDIWMLCSDIRGLKKEHFVSFYLDTQNRVIDRQIISIGTLDSSQVHPREVYEPAVSLHAQSIIIAHNHPSGSLQPSMSDLSLTKRLIESGKILGINLEDHIILTDNDYLSLRAKDLIKY